MLGCIRRLIWILAVVASSDVADATEPNVLPRELVDAGWMLLFDGETFAGWQSTGDAKWEVADGEIRSAGDKPGFLMTNGAFADFELRVEFKAPAATNSGVFLRTPLKPTDPTKDCYELNIAPRDNPFPTGSLVGRQRLPTDDVSGVLSTFPLPGLKAVDADVFNLWDGKWHSFEVVMNGGKVIIRLDDQVGYEYTDPKPLRSGRIALQSNQGEVAFRNIRIRKLPR
jgi:hypothetical protein